MKDMKKMLAAVMVLAVAFAGVTMITSSETDAATNLDQAGFSALIDNNNTISVATDYNVTFTTASDITSLTINKSPAATSDVTVTITMFTSSDATNIFTNASITVGQGVTLKLIMKAADGVSSPVNNNHILAGSTLNVNGTVILTQYETLVKGVSVYQGSISVADGAKLILDRAGGIQGVATSIVGTGSIEAKNNTQAASMSFSSLSMATGSKITISDGDSSKMKILINGSTNTVAGTIDAGASKIVLNSAADNSGAINLLNGTLKAAEITSYYAAREFTINDGTIIGKIVNAPLAGGIASNTMNFSGTTFDKTSTIGSDVTAVLTNAIVKENATLNVIGTVSGSVTNNGTLAIQNSDSSAVSDLTIKPASTGSIDTSAISEDAYLGGTIDSTSTNTTFGVGQIVHIVDDLVIKSGAVIIINGILEVPEGMTITIEDGGKLIVSGVTAAINNDGEIVVESGYVAGHDSEITTDGAFQVIDATLNNDGTIVAAYEGISDVIAINFNGVVNNNGTITINDETNNQVSIGGKFVNKGILESYGSLTIVRNVVINNYDKIIIDGEYNNDYNVAIVVASVDSEIDIISIYGDAFIVDDSAITKADSKNDVVNKDAGKENKLTITPNGDYAVTGITITETITSVKGTNGTSYYKDMILTGTVEVDYVGDDTAVEGNNIVIDVTRGTRVFVTDALVLSKDANMSVQADMVLNVTGEMTVADGAFEIVAGGPAKIASVGNAGTIVVTGKITADKSEIEGKIYAASYKVVTSSPASTTYIYTTLEVAIESGAKAIDINGEMTVSKNITVPSGVTITQKTGELTIFKDAVVSVSDGAKFIQKASSTINVKGTLYVEVKKTGLKTAASDSITSEVISEGEKDIRYTNLANAIVSAGSSDVVIKLSGDVDISTDMAIPSNVTINTDGNKITVIGCKLTVDGVLYLKDDSSKLVTTDDDGPLPKEASVVINGYIVSTDNIVYNGDEFPAGAYYSTKVDNVTYNVVTAVENAPAILSTAIDQEIEICGKNKVGDLSFVGKDDGATVYIKGDLTAGKVTIDNATIIFSTGKKITAAIINGDNSVAMVDTLIGNIDAQISSTVDSDEVKHFAVSGSIGVQESKEATYNLGISGTVEASNLNLSALLDFKYYSIIIDGVLVITENSVLGDVLVNGTLVVDNGKTASATDVTVFGTIDAKVATADEPVAGTVSVDKIYAGMTASEVKYTTATAPVLNGDIGATTAFIIDGTVVPESISKATGVKSTQFIVEDSAWMTIYTTDSTMVIGGVSNAPLTDAVLGITVDQITTKWLTNDKKTSADASRIGADKCDKVYANVNYYIYNVSIVGDAGIGSVAIDGVVLIKGAGSHGENVFTLSGTMLKAGTHTVTYVLKDGFEGSPVLIKDGSSLGGLTFSLSGTEPADMKVSLNLSGTKAVDPSTPTPTPTPVEPTKDDSMGITEYLLIVLVVLAAILVVVVAIRMMRS